MASGPPFPPLYDPNASPYGTPPPLAGNDGGYQWQAPAALPGGGYGAPPPGWNGQPGRAPLYDLRPLSTGEVLDRTFSLYRSRFLLFAGIASVAAAVRLVGSGLQLAVQQAGLRHRGIYNSTTNVVVTVIVSIMFLLVFTITQAATVWAMGEVYLGRSASVSAALRMTGKRWARYLGIALWQGASGFWPALAVGVVAGGVWLLNGRSFGSLGAFGAAGLTVLLVLLAMVAGLILYLRNLLAIPASVREDLPVRAAMRRSKILSAGAKGKLFLVLLIAGALYMVMGMVLMMVAAIVMAGHQLVRAGAPSMNGAFLTIGIATLAVGFVGYTLISPVILIGTSMVYFDQRVRKEAYDVAVLLGDEAGMGGSAIAPAPATAVPEPAVMEPDGGASGL